MCCSQKGRHMNEQMGRQRKASAHETQMPATTNNNGADESPRLPSSCALPSMSALVAFPLAPHFSMLLDVPAALAAERFELASMLRFCAATCDARGELEGQSGLGQAWPRCRGARRRRRRMSFWPQELVWLLRCRGARRRHCWDRLGHWMLFRRGSK